MLYVDDGHWPLGRMRMSHLLADSPGELRDAARHLGLERHIQYPGTPKEHLDVSRSKRGQAIRELNAREISGRELVAIVQARRDRENKDTPRASEWERRPPPGVCAPFPRNKKQSCTPPSPGGHNEEER